MSDFRFAEQTNGGELVLTFEGMIDEDVAFPAVDPTKYQGMTIDLKGVKTINSVGIREWLNWIRPIAARIPITLARAPKAMVFQFNMVEGFLPANSKVTSFYVPYFCDECDKEENVLFKLGEEVQVSGGQVKINFDAQAAKLCGKENCEMEMDVTESKYFQFLKRTAT